MKLVFIEQGHTLLAKQLWKWEIPASYGQIKGPLSTQSLHTCELQEWECHRWDNRCLTFGQLWWQNQMFWSPAGCREGFIAGGKCTLASGRPAVPLVTSSFSRKALFSYHVRFSLLEIQLEAMCTGVRFSIGLFQWSPLLLSHRALSNEPVWVAGCLSPARWERNRV